MVILEFNGVPGCGKSTLCEYLVNVLKKQKIVIGTRDSLYSDLYTNNKILINFFAFFEFKQIIKNMKIIKLIFTYGFSFERLKWARGLIVLNYLLKLALNKKLYHFLILDEGVVQYLTSIPHNKEFLLNKNEINLMKSLFYNFSDSVIIINCEVELEIVIKRIQKRGKGSPRFDLLSDEELEFALITKKNNIQNIRDFIKAKQVIFIDMEESINKNSDYILMNIKE